MPDEPTTELLKFIDTWKSACAGWKGIKPGILEIPESECMKCPDRMKCIAVNKAIRRRLECKVSREWVEKWEKEINLIKAEALNGKIFAHGHSKRFVIAMLKELDMEVGE